MAGQNPGSPTDFQYFYEDEVYKINNRGQVVFGLVLENYEANSSDQESDIETPIQKGEIRVVWHPSGTERVISEKSVGLADRSLMPGDVVRRLIAGKDTQRGYCRDIIMNAALQIVGTKHVIPSVASERLQPLEEFTPDLAVCLDSWVGTSKAVHSKLRLVSAEGSRLEYPDLDTCPLEDYSMRRRRSTPYSSSEFYPGQVVYGPLGSLDSANWLHITKEMKAARKHKMHDHKFTVEAVMTESVSVHWQCRALCTNPTDPTTPQQPKFLVEGEDLKNLKLLNVFEPCTLQVGDRNFLTIGPEDTFVSKKQWRKQQSKYYRNLRKQTKPIKKPSKTDTNSTDHVPSRPKKRASAHRKLKSNDNDMEVDPAEDKLESLDDALKMDATCPSIKIEPIGDVCLPMASSQEDTATEEKNDSGIRWHVRSPEPARDDSSLLNGDSKSDNALNDDDSDNWENTSSDGSDTDSELVYASGATWSSRCSSAASGRGKRSPQLAVRLLRGKRLKRTVRRAPPAPPPRPGDRVVVETLHTTSRANVVWQDGTIEMGIPSTQLYPIHHLDGQECFPGDFVVSGAANVEENQQLKHREYGVVQRVDHHGRTAIVHWYRTYTSADEPVPQMLHESEVSVYDLKDHPDFQYRPGTVVIRVANFTGEDANCTAGQVIDNFPSGRVKVWWVDGHTSMCWPQDLYKVGEYDSEEGELWGSEGSGSEDSWETQSSAPPSPPPDPMLVDDELERSLQALQALQPEGTRAIITSNVTVEPMQIECSVSKKQLHLNIDIAQATSSDTASCTQELAHSENPSTETAEGDPSLGKNVCYKLCSLIHAQLIKAHAEVSRRRPQELADFLNSLVKIAYNSEENLAYHFSVQYGALVVSITEEDKGDSKVAEVKDATTATAQKSEGPAASETAPLATAEGTEEAEMDTAIPPVSLENKEGGEGFCILESAPAAHRFRLSMLQPSEPRTFYSAVKREIKLLKSDLPPGVWVRGYEDRIDLLSVMIAGPTKTPYEGGLFVFDVQLGGEYPRAPPLCHYHSYCTDRLNPNLYEDGKVCVSLLGTWSGRGVEVWGKDSSLLQVIVSLQGLILNSEPYFNEAGYEKQKGTQQGKENSRMYNEMVLLKLVQSMTKMLMNPPEPFRAEILTHMRSAAGPLCTRLEGLVRLSGGAADGGAAAAAASEAGGAGGAAPEFPLVPASRGFCLTLRSSLESFRVALRRHEISVPPPSL
ncbi:(E3-independent) E2 ubiquitin-conjugating enzyme UBE2O isoform X8 [Spodoptera frugiperda]|uniref:(E3-independent) E2 ubiquitin-conjugating enzyme UBE2O isoform X8 n=1 Tax=Spodoptera frugiperda TaxID=7108 RepID=A0A9R0E8C4_SPOFR|nr:(E3-independent) E2 ubiquitin-conjugating enzyme UBE2O isoform X8 [Spodoptera frugiperda]